jgi:hypothetical protein
MRRFATIWALLGWVAGVTAASAAGLRPLDRAQIREIVDTYVIPQIEDGSAIGAEVGITLGGKPPMFFSYGLSRFATRARDRERFAPDTRFSLVR